MIKIDKAEVFNFEGALRGMRNPLESNRNSDSHMFWGDEFHEYIIGEKDLALASRLANAGADHGKFLRQIFVSIDVTAPLYWFKEFDTYKVGTVANSTSTMHLLGSRDLVYDDFSWDYPTAFRTCYLIHINELIATWRKDKSEENFRIMIQDLLDSFNQTRTITLNYAVLRNIYSSRKNHKLLEWRLFCDWIREQPYASELIISSK